MRPEPSFAARAALILLLLAVAEGCDLRSDKSKELPSGKPSLADAQPVPATTQPEFSTLTADAWLGLSLSYYQQQRYLESIGAAQTAVNLRPGFAEAYTNIGAAYSALHLWDLAIQSAQQALTLEPEVTLAKNNLAWALEQKRLGVR